MAKRSSGKKQGHAKTPSGKGANSYPVTDPLRLLLHQLEIALGLFPAQAGFDGQERFHEPLLLEANGPVPAGMRAEFAGDFAALERIGKSTERCHGLTLSPLKLFCLPYYYFDGFNALLYAERDGRFFAAWKEQEMHTDRSPETVRAPGPLEEFQAVFRQALSIPG